MFSIENLLSNKYTSKSSQNAKNRDQVDSISATTPSSRKTGHIDNGGMTEVNSFAGKRDTLYLELSATANARSSTEGASGERGTVDMRLKSPQSKMTVMTGKIEQRSRKRRSDGGEEESESDSDERDSGSEQGMIFVQLLS